MSDIPAPQRQKNAGMKLCGVLLAGGRSSRMGTDKCLLKIRDRALWQRQVERLLRVSHCVAVAAPSRPEWMPSNLAFVPDTPTAGGPLAGILPALNWSCGEGATHLLVLAVDMPNVTAQGLGNLVRRCSNGQGVVPLTDSSLEPLCAVYPTAALKYIEADALLGNFAMRGIARRLIALGLLMPADVTGTLSMKNPMFVNWNTPGDMKSHPAR